MEIFNNTTKVVKDDLEKRIQKGSKISIAAACFSIYAYQELKENIYCRENKERAEGVLYPKIKEREELVWNRV